MTDLTLIVEPDFNGHRFESVAHVVEVARTSGRAVLVTSTGASLTQSYHEHLGDLEVTTYEVFGSIQPSTRELVEAVAALVRSNAVDTVVVMDADQSLKKWWLLAPGALRGLRPRPRVVFMLTRYPARLRIGDPVGWKLRISKATLAVLAMASGSLHRVAGFAGRDERSTGWIVKRARDPAINNHHSRDRAHLRELLGLPADRTLVGIFGGVGERKHPALTLDAIVAADIDADLLLAGRFDDVVRAWYDDLPGAARSRVIAVDAYLSNEQLDQYVASANAVALIMTNNGPSGIQGKALAAGVPVVSAGSLVRARELAVTGGGAAADFSVPAIGSALRRVLDDGWTARPSSSLPPATGAEYARTILGVEASGEQVRRGRR